MAAWLSRWLPILFGCHCREDRSFHFRGQKFPICARCTGELAGIILGLATYLIWHPGWTMFVAAMVPLVLDGGLQALTPYESGNGRRLVTGLLFGYGLTGLILFTTGRVFSFGMDLGIRWCAAAQG